MIELINRKNQAFLLSLARLALETYVTSGKTIQPEIDELDEEVIRQGATFVTLHLNNQLRGCIGTLSAYQPVYADVIEHAIAAGTKDYRFPVVRKDELKALHYEVSLLSDPVPLRYTSPEDLLAQLRMGVDGVVISSGFQRATFLPQVWESIPDKEEFMNQLCRKMGVRANAWRNMKYDVSVYQVQEFAE